MSRGLGSGQDADEEGPEVAHVCDFWMVFSEFNSSSVLLATWQVGGGQRHSVEIGSRTSKVRRENETFERREVGSNSASCYLIKRG